MQIIFRIYNPKQKRINTHTLNFLEKNIYFLGIGGIGMSAIARFFKQNDCFVAGYDLTKTELTEQLEAEGILVNYEDEIENIPTEIIDNFENSLIIYTPAIPKKHKQLNYFLEKGYKIYKRAKVLGMLSENLKTIGVAGTHGKTTISAITTHIFKENNLLNAAFVGGILKNYKSNLVLGNNNQDNWLILEADEFDRSFLNFKPNYSVISATDADHLDIYESKNNLIDAFKNYIDQTSEKVILNDKIDSIKPESNKYFRYGLNFKSDFYAKNIRIDNSKQIFDIVFPEGECENVEISLPGNVNVENSVAAFSLAYSAGVEPANIQKSLGTFKGIERRFDLILKNEKVVYINDYAHHPVEIERLREAVATFYPNRKITAIFQPHLFSRTKDFAEGFAQELSKFDEILLMDIYPARELPMEGVTSKIIFDKIENTKKEMCSFDNIIKKIKSKDIDILLTIGAGSIINIVEPLKNIFE